MAQRQFQKGIIRENTRGEREILIPVQMHTSSSRSHQTYEADSELQQQQQQERIFLLNELEEWKVLYAGMQSKCAHLEDHLDKFDDFISRYNELNREHDQLVAACQERENDFRELESRTKEIQTELQECKDNNTELSSQLKRKKTQIVDLQKKLKEEMQKRADELQEKTDELHSKEQELNEMKQALYRQETEEKKRRKTLEMDISKLNDATIDLEAQNKRLQEMVDRYKREIAGLKSMLNQYQKREESPSVQPILPLPSRREKSSESENYLKLQLQQLSSDLKFKQQELEEHIAKDSERLSKLRGELELVRKELRQSKSRCEELMTANADLQSSNAEMAETIERYEKEIEALRNSRKPAERCNHPQKIKALEEEIEKYKQQIKDQSIVDHRGEQQSEELHRLREQIREDKAISKKTITSLEKTIAGLQKTVAGFDKTVSSLEKTIEELKRQLSEERNENSRLVDLVDKREKELAAASAALVEASRQKQPVPALPTDRDDQEYQKMLRELKRDIQQKNASHKKLVEQLQAEITQLKTRLQRQSTIEEVKPVVQPAQPPPVQPALPSKPPGKSAEQYNHLLELLERKDKELVQLRIKLDELQRFHSSSLAALEQQNIKLIRLLESERVQWSTKQLTLSESKKIIGRLQSELTRLNDELESMRMRHCNSSLAFKQKENRLAFLERRLQKSEDSIMRQDERQLYEAKICSKNELIELLTLKLHNLEQQYLRTCSPSGLCFYR